MNKREMEIRQLRGQLPTKHEVRSFTIRSIPGFTEGLLVPPEDLSTLPRHVVDVPIGFIPTIQDPESYAVELMGRLGADGKLFIEYCRRLGGYQ